ncbi:hypothetical protein [Xanthomonas sp. NCPPB 1128]|uniref:hypothetical protein n=1 Tax=Xanthomonas sp. NCPPB 1128 TaxID=1775876 RepID=UPI001038CD8C|nr:hypothetical protein [Xanthomonas sp. NCPPB 1128]
MSDKSLPIVLTELAVTAFAVAGIFFALNVGQVPNCASIERQAIFMWILPVSVTLGTGCVTELLIGMREDSRLSKAISALCAFSLALLWVIYKWKLNAISTLAC